MRVLDVARPPTALSDPPPDVVADAGRVVTGRAIAALPGAGAVVAARASQAIGLEIMPALRTGDYAGAASAFVRSTAAGLGVLPAGAIPAAAGGLIGGAAASVRSGKALQEGDMEGAAGALVEGALPAVPGLALPPGLAAVAKEMAKKSAPMDDPGDDHPTGPTEVPPPTTADRARDGLAVLAHPLAWEGH
jgi:hypothetical protein